MRAEEIQLAHEWVLVKPDKLKTFKHIEIHPVMPTETMNVVKDEKNDEPDEVEVEEVERTIAFIIQKGTVVAIGAGDSGYKIGDKVFIRSGTGMVLSVITYPRYWRALRRQRGVLDCVDYRISGRNSGYYTLPMAVCRCH